MQAIVVDDSRAMRAILKKTLKAMSLEVVEAGDGREALQHLDPNRVPQIALVDWNMPVMNGLELVQAIRKDSTYDSMPILMVTTEVEIEQISKALEAGANEYLMKPFDEEALREKLLLLGVGQEAA